MMIRTVALGLLAPLLLGALPGSAGAQATRPDSLALARQFTQWLYAAEVDSLYAYTGLSMLENMSSAEWWREPSDAIALRAGRELEVISETFRMRNGRPQYWRVARFSDLDEPLLVRFVIGDTGLIDGLGLGPLSQAPRTDP